MACDIQTTRALTSSYLTGGICNNILGISNFFAPLDTDINNLMNGSLLETGSVGSRALELNTADTAFTLAGSTFPVAETVIATLAVTPCTAGKSLLTVNGQLVQATTGTQTGEFRIYINGILSYVFSHQLTLLSADISTSILYSNPASAYSVELRQVRTAGTTGTYNLNYGKLGVVEF